MPDFVNVMTDQILIGVWGRGVSSNSSVSNALALAVAVGANEIFATEASPPTVAPLALRLISDP